jgi:hypothetical protein
VTSSEWFFVVRDAQRPPLMNIIIPRATSRTVVVLLDRTGSESFA